jgi:hypothetical protein
MAVALSVLCGGHVDDYHPGCVGQVLPGGRLRIVDPIRGAMATYPPASWTILTAPGVADGNRIYFPTICD